MIWRLTCRESKQKNRRFQFLKWDIRFQQLHWVKTLETNFQGQRAENKKIA